jgi:hypothetical protein
MILNLNPDNYQTQRGVILSTVQTLGGCIAGYDALAATNNFTDFFGTAVCYYHEFKSKHPDYSIAEIESLGLDFNLELLYWVLETYPIDKGNELKVLIAENWNADYLAQFRHTPLLCVVAKENLTFTDVNRLMGFILRGNNPEITEKKKAFITKIGALSWQ